MQQNPKQIKGKYSATMNYVNPFHGEKCFVCKQIVKLGEQFFYEFDSPKGSIIRHWNCDPNYPNRKICQACKGHGWISESYYDEAINGGIGGWRFRSPTCQKCNGLGKV